MSPANPQPASALALLPRIDGRILVLRGHKVLIDADLAELYGVPTKALNQAVKRNANRFPGDFMFHLDAAEKAEVVTNCDHLQKLKFSKSLPYAFTEHGAIQAANVLASDQAVEMGITWCGPLCGCARPPACTRIWPGAWQNSKRRRKRWS